ncbi:MAG TPA: hypothetical protein VFH72_08675 [Candidatus Baltobacteraceae bacterium]|nr:hypothetical protein [Candidatus Baltobacteraceae bacterium]
MFNEVEGLLKRAETGEIDKNSLEQATQEHVQSVDDLTVAQHMQRAADNASQNGKPDLAQQISDMLRRDRSNPQALKQDIVQLVKNNPDILKHFEGGFAKNILSRIGQ